MNLWDEILARVETKVNRHSFYTWFKPTSFVSDDGRSVTVRVPNMLFQEWMTKHYFGVINEALQEVNRADAIISFVATPAGEGDAPAAPPAEMSPESIPPSTTR
jgi:chromosomal replication initiator protein